MAEIAHLNFNFVHAKLIGSSSIQSDVHHEYLETQWISADRSNALMMALDYMERMQNQSNL